MPDSISQAEFQEKFEALASENKEVFALYKDDDGNWRGGGFKNGQWVSVRDIGPETVLQLLLTHDGQGL